MLHSRNLSLKESATEGICHWRNLITQGIYYSRNLSLKESNYSRNLPLKESVTQRIYHSKKLSFYYEGIYHSRNPLSLNESISWTFNLSLLQSNLIPSFLHLSSTYPGAGISLVWNAIYPDCLRRRIFCRRSCRDLPLVHHGSFHLPGRPLAVHPDHGLSSLQQCQLGGAGLRATLHRIRGPREGLPGRRIRRSKSPWTCQFRDPWRGEYFEPENVGFDWLKLVTWLDTYSGWLKLVPDLQLPIRVLYFSTMWACLRLVLPRLNLSQQVSLCVWPLTSCFTSLC